MGKLTAIETYDRFANLWEGSQISDTSLTFILDTGLLYTHGFFLNSVVYGQETSEYVPITVAGVTKNISLSGHSHTGYYSKDANLNISNYKIVSGQYDLLLFTNGDLIIGSSDIPTYLNGTITTTRNNTNYTILDTGNFSITLVTSTNQALSNVATFKYGSSSFLLDYVKRIEQISTFDLVNTYTNFGTLSENSKWYGFMTMYTDSNTTNPKYALIRVDITGNTLEFRTSSHTSWTGLLLGGAYKNLPINGTNYEIVTKAANLPNIWAPSALGNAKQVLSVSDDAQSLVWRDNTNLTASNNGISISNEVIQLSLLSTTKNAEEISGKLYAVELDKNGKLAVNVPWTSSTVINSKTDDGYVTKGQNHPNKVWMTDDEGAPDWRDMDITNTLSSATVDRLGVVKVYNVLSTPFTIESTNNPTEGRYYGVQIDGSNKLFVNVPWNNTWVAMTGATVSNDGTIGYINTAPPSDGYNTKFLRADGTWEVPTNTWKAANNSQEGYVPKLSGNGTIATQSTEYVLTFTSGGTNTITPTWKLLPTNAFANTWNLGSDQLAGYVPKATKDYFLHCNNNTGVLEWVANPNTNTWRGVYVEGTSKVGTGTNTLPINFVAGSNVSITYEAAGTGSSQSGSASYFNIKITSTNTWNAMTGATASANGTVGYVNATPPKDGYNTKFLRADGTWSVPAYPTKSSWNYDDKYITAVGVTDDSTNHANQLRYVLNGTSTYFTVPYASTTNLALLIWVDYCRGDSSLSNSGEWSRIKNTIDATGRVTGRVKFYTVYKDGGPVNYGEVLEICSRNGSYWQPQLFFGAGKTGDLYYRNKNSNDDSWGDWRTLIHSGNYTSYTVTKTGTGASGDWDINITGSAATAASATNTNNALLTNTVTNTEYPLIFGSSWTTGNDYLSLRKGIVSTTAANNPLRVCPGVNPAANTEGNAYIVLGNNLAKSAANNRTGSIYLYGAGAHWGRLIPTAVTANRTYTFPNESGWAAVGAIAGVGNASQPVYLNASGILTACTTVAATTINVTLNTSSNAAYPIIWCSPADATTLQSSIYKTYNKFTFNPKTFLLVVSGNATVGSLTSGSSIVMNGGYFYMREAISTNADTGVGTADNRIYAKLGTDGETYGIRFYSAHDPSTTFTSYTTYFYAGYGSLSYTQVAAGTLGYQVLTLGGSAKITAANSCAGMLRLYTAQPAGNTATVRYGSIYPVNLTGNRSYYLPDASGTIALTTDIANNYWADVKVSSTSNTGTTPRFLRIGLGTAVNSSYSLAASGNCSAANYYTTSDRSKKQDITTFSEHIRKFQLKDTEKWHYGVIAQEVDEIFREGEEGSMTVNYNSILSYYIGMLENKVDEMLLEINNLKKLIYYGSN